MAKKEPAEEAPEEGGEAAAPKAGGKKKLILIGALALALIGGGGGAGYFFFLRKAPDAEASKAAPKPVAFVDVREMVINLAAEPNQERPRMLRFKVALEVKDAKQVPEIQPLLPRVEDLLQVFVRELRASDLDGSAGLYRLREELQRRVNVAVYPAKVDAVLFKDFIVQ